MAHFKFAEIGRMLSVDWGRECDCSSAFITSSDVNTKILCVLCAIHSRLSRIQSLTDMATYRQPEPKRESQTEHYVADGMLRALLGSTGDRPIDDCDRPSLSVRARKALIRGGFKFLHELNAETLIELKNCGQTTVDEILEWKAKQHPTQRELT